MTRGQRLSCAAAVADSPMGGSKIWDRWLLRNQALLMLLLQEMRRVNFYLIWKEDGNSMGLPTNIWAQGDDGGPYPSDRRNDFLVFVMTLLGRKGLVEGVCVFKKQDYFFYILYSAASCCDKNVIIKQE